MLVKTYDTTDYLKSQDTFFSLKLCLRQFSVRVAFAMSINKSQDQTFNRVGSFLRESVSSPVQRHVAFSSVCNMIDIKIDHSECGAMTKNTVYREILDK